MNTFISISSVIGAVLILAICAFVISFIVTVAIQVTFSINDNDLAPIAIIVCSVVCAILIVVILYSNGILNWRS